MDITLSVTKLHAAWARLRHPLLATLPTKTSLIRICPITTSMKASKKIKAGAPNILIMMANSTAFVAVTKAKMVRVECLSSRCPAANCAKAAMAKTKADQTPTRVREAAISCRRSSKNFGNA